MSVIGYWYSNPLSTPKSLMFKLKHLGVDNGFECQLLGTDSFLSHTSLVQQVGTHHAIIKVRQQSALLLFCGVHIFL